MTGATYKRATICAAVDEPREVTAIRQWLGKWEASLRYLEPCGCGCCVEMYDVLAPAVSLAELPEAVLTESEWTRGGEASGGQGGR